MPSITPFIKYIIIACGIVWLIQVVVPAVGGPDLARLLGIVPAAVASGRLWQPVTYMWLHSPNDLFHLLINMFMLWMFGGELERYWGSRAFLRYYLVCGIGSGIITFLFNYFIGYQHVSVVGASGAIFGLFMAYGMIFGERIVLLMFLFPMKARTMALIMFGVTFFYTLTQSGSGISHISHLGGAIVGFLYLKRAWRVGVFYRDLKWKMMRKRFKVMPPRNGDDTDRWVN
jgi:membrane associated rhomboid family serine protease